MEKRSIKTFVFDVFMGFLIRVWTVIGGLVTVIELSEWIDNGCINSYVNVMKNLFQDNVLSIFIGSFILYMIYYFFVFSRYSFEINANVHVKIRIANILKQKGNIIVGINSELNNDREKIGYNSIHYQLIKNENIKKSIDNAFMIKKNDIPLEMGEFFTISGNKEKQNIILLVMSRLKTDTNPYSTKDLITKAVNSLFTNQEKVENRIGNKLTCPVLGKGAVGDNESIEERIKLLVKLYAKYADMNEEDKYRRFKDFVIVLKFRDFINIKNFNLLKKELDFIIINCSNCSIGK